MMKLKTNKKMGDKLINIKNNINQRNKTQQQKLSTHKFNSTTKKTKDYVYLIHLAILSLFLSFIFIYILRIYKQLFFFLFL
jgi:hypothetical protein